MSGAYLALQSLDEVIYSFDFSIHDSATPWSRATLAEWAYRRLLSDCMRFMAPPGIPENVEELVVPAGGPAHIAPHVRPFVKRNSQGVIGVDVLCEAVSGNVGGIFGFECTEKPVPDNKRAAVVAVDVVGLEA